MRKISLVGREFGRLTVVAESAIRTPQGRILWYCTCTCGGKVSVRGGDLQQGKTTSCGCLVVERTREMGKVSVHGMSGTPTWKSWESMIARCYRSTETSFKNYGAKGVTVSASWLQSFANFLEDMGERPEGMTLDRIDNSKGYSKENCRWATTRQQANNKGNNVRLFYKGRTLTVAMWATKLGVPAATIYTRLRKGWSIQEALTIQYRRRRP